MLHAQVAHYGTAATARCRQQWINRLPCYSQRVQAGERRPGFWQGARQLVAAQPPAFSEQRHSTGWVSSTAMTGAMPDLRGPLDQHDRELNQTTPHYQAKLTVV